MKLPIYKKLRKTMTLAIIYCHVKYNNKRNRYNNKNLQQILKTLIPHKDKHPKATETPNDKSYRNPKRLKATETPKR